MGIYIGYRIILGVKTSMELIGEIPSGEVDHTLQRYGSIKNRKVNIGEKSIEMASPYFKQGLLGLTTYSSKRQYKLSVADRLLRHDNVDVNHRKFGGQCVASYSVGEYMYCMVFKQSGRLKQELHLVDPYALNTISYTEVESTAFPENFTDPRELAKVTGVYTYTDRHGKIIISGSNGHVRWYGTADGIISLLADYHLQDMKFTAVIPDFNGNMWFTTRDGTVGVNCGNRYDYMVLQGETIEKSFSINKDGVAYVVSDKALYAISYNNGEIKIKWRFHYDLPQSDIDGSHSEAIFKGSGTTPLLIGSELVVIADNSTPTYNILFVDQKTGELLSKVNTPFSLTQCSLVAYEDKSVITVNNSGYGTFINFHVKGSSPQPGVALVDIDLGIRWVNNTVIPSTALPLYCVHNDLLLLYTMNSDRIWSLTSLSGSSGDVIYNVPVGYGPDYDSHWSPILINDLGHIMIGTLTGLITIM